MVPAMVKPISHQAQSLNAPTISTEPLRQENDAVQQRLDAAMEELGHYKPLIELASAAESRQSQPSTRFSWSHPLSLVIRS